MTFHDPFAEPPKDSNKPQKPDRVAATIPTAVRLEELNLEDELLTLYTKATELLRDSEYDESIPLNQKAQAQNSIVSILTTIIKNQEAVRNMAEIATIEAALGDTLKEFPDIKEAFLTAYEGKLMQNLRVTK